MESKAINMIVENVKIDKIIFMEIYTPAKIACDYFKNAIVITERARKSLFVFIVIARRTRK